MPQELVFKFSVCKDSILLQITCLQISFHRENCHLQSLHLLLRRYYFSTTHIVMYFLPQRKRQFKKKAQHLLHLSSEETLISRTTGIPTFTVALSSSASEDVGDKGLIGLREGELSTLEMQSGSGTYKIYKEDKVVRSYVFRFTLDFPPVQIYLLCLLKINYAKIIPTPINCHRNDELKEKTVVICIQECCLEDVP